MLHRCVLVFLLMLAASWFQLSSFLCLSSVLTVLSPSQWHAQLPFLSQRPSLDPTSCLIVSHLSYPSAVNRCTVLTLTFQPADVCPSLQAVHEVCVLPQGLTPPWTNSTVSGVTARVEDSTSPSFHDVQVTSISCCPVISYCCDTHILVTPGKCVVLRTTVTALAVRSVCFLPGFPGSTLSNDACPHVLSLCIQCMSPVCMVYHASLMCIPMRLRCVPLGTQCSPSLSGDHISLPCLAMNNRNFFGALLHALSVKGCTWSFCLPRVSFLYMSASSPLSVCHRLGLLMHRHLMRRHDFLVLMTKLCCPLPWSGCCALIRGEVLSASLLWKLQCEGYHIPSVPALSLSLVICAVHTSYEHKIKASHEHFLSCLTHLKLNCVPSMENSDCHASDFQPDKTLLGGGRPHVFAASEVLPFICGPVSGNDKYFTFVDYVDVETSKTMNISEGCVVAAIPLLNLVPHVPVRTATKIGHYHKIKFGSHVPKNQIVEHFAGHQCVDCPPCVGIFKGRQKLIVRTKASTTQSHHSCITPVLVKQELNAVTNVKPEGAKSIGHLSDGGATEQESVPNHLYPPPPLSSDLAHTVIRDFCDESQPSRFEEAGCAVCGQLTPTSSLSPLKSIKGMLGILESPGVTRVERKSSTDAIREFKGPVLDYSCNKICAMCRVSIRKGNVPVNALARGLWIGKVPPELSELRFIEKLLIARLRHNCCFVRVASGMRKMTSHVVAFQSPTPKLYQALPPPLEDLDEVLAILFTGPTKPTQKDFERTPLLVRRNAVARALEWLKLNHSDYSDLEISYTNLAQYPEDDPPVSVEYKPSTMNKFPENTSSFDDEAEDGTEHGDCPFVVHGLTGESLDTMTSNRLKAIALTHLNKGQKMLAVGHSSKLESIYNNPQYFPQMFPWLFPYGLGGIGSSDLSEAAHKRFLLMYHDKRFQTDIYFPFVAFSHSQIKASTTGAFLLSDRKSFHDVTNRILNVDQTVLADLVKRMSTGETVKPQTPAEKDCFQMIRDLDQVSQHVEGSVTTKKYMRTEIWSTMAYYGAPSWYITLSPADVKHPICLYFADKKESFMPSLREYDERIQLIAANPVAGARFFHFMVELFIKHVLGVESGHPGIYGDTAAYYGTVEQQGRLTLHLHMLLWIKGCLSPQEVRDRVMDPNSDFQRRLIEYLESVHVGEFLTGSQTEVLGNVAQASKSATYLDPTQTLPQPPPKHCKTKCGCCKKCKAVEAWNEGYLTEVDDLLSKSNIHRCSESVSTDTRGSQVKVRRFVGCMDNKWGRCKARFPRPIFETTEVDPETGAINMKKLEPMINTISPVVTYLFRCNTDITSLKSGTAIKGVILYVTDYITKASLKTHVMFDVIRSTFQKNSELLGGSDTRKEKARRLMTKIVNNLSAKLEFGSPMAAMYLLRNPDHYTNLDFAPFYWKSYVTEARRPWQPPNEEEGSDKVVLVKSRGRIIGLSPVYDYVYRPAELEELCLYDWVQTCKREKYRKSQSKPQHCDIELSGEGSTSEETASESGLDDSGSDSDSGSSLDNPTHNVNSQPKNTPSLPMKIPGLYEFTKGHPLHETHGTRYNLRKDTVVPNFIGETLPRRDKGDRELYCSTMLAFFKPWRSGIQLKAQDQTWNDAFDLHQFSKYHTDIMDNFNLRYECLDARDDFHAQLKKGATPIPGWSSPFGHEDMSSDAVASQNDRDAGNEGMVGTEYADFDMDVSHIGRRESKRRHDMTTMHNVMQQTGWTLPMNQDHIHSAPPSDIVRTANQWKAEVKRMRQNILSGRAKEPNSDAPGENSVIGSKPGIDHNQVRIVDKSYLEKSRQSVAHKKIIDSIAQKFELNTEQDRAFRLVANHACNPTSEQLKMYIGGMGGTGKTQVLKALVEFFNVTNQSRRFVVVAPTGTAAALLGGSTYHYLFGFNDRPDDALPNNLLLQLRARFEGVSYIFLDEVSMLSCHDMYRISLRLAKILNVTDLLLVA